MKVAVLSDIHDNVWALKVALAGVQEADALICCGDLCSPFVVDLLADGFSKRPVHLVFGNNDVVCFGHNHHFQVERIGRTLAINPGTIMGYDPVKKTDIVSTLVLYDTKTDEASGYQVTVPQGSLTYPGLSQYP